MLKVEFVEVSLGDNHIEKYAIINGKQNLSPVEDSIYIFEEDIISELSNYSFNEIKKYFNAIELQFYILDSEMPSKIVFYFTGFSDSDFRPHVGVEVYLDSEDWTNSYSISEFKNAIQQILPLMQCENIWKYSEDIFDEDFLLLTSPNSYECNFGNELNKIKKEIEEIMISGKIKALESISNESVVMYFRFPEQVKTASKQYLIYFTQFLEDLGIKANADISEEIGQTLFKVTPVDKEEALDKIKDALSIYLNAPADSSFNENIKVDDVAVMQWQANILHLKSQLTLAASIIETKQATIDTLKLTNYQLTEIIKKNDETKQEPIIKDLVSVKKYEGKALVINWPEIVRRLKRKLK